MVAFIIIIIVIILLFIQPHVIYHKQSTQMGFLAALPGGKDPLEDEIANHSSILAWRIPQTEEPGELQSMG